MASIYEKLGENIKKYRRKRNMSQEDLASRAKVDITTIAKIESSPRNPSLNTLYKIANGLGIKLKDLVDF